MVGTYKLDGKEVSKETFYKKVYDRDITKSSTQTTSTKSSSKNSTSQLDTKRTSSNPRDEDYSLYGTKEMPNTDITRRADGSTEYYKNGVLMKEVDPTGKNIIRVNVDTSGGKC